MSGSGGGGGGGPFPLARHLQHAHNHQGSSRGGSQEPVNQRFSNLIHDSELFLTKLREFKPQSLGCLEARRKSSSTLIFPSPQQACMGPPKCPRYPHNVKPTPGYWIECHGPGVLPPSSKHSHSHLHSHSHSHSHSHAASSSSERAAVGVSPQLAGGAPVGARASVGSLDERRDSIPRLGSLDRDDKSVAPITAPAAAGASAAGSPFADEPVPDWDAAGPRRAHAADSAKPPPPPPASGGHAPAPLPPLAPAVPQPLLKRRQSCDGDQPVSCVQQQQEQLDLSSELAHEPAAEPAAAGDAEPPSAARRQRVTPRSSMSGSTRRRMNKRTMTRDDIDLHKTRRGTPNITITEPSFNQSTTSPFGPGRPRIAPVASDSESSPPLGGSSCTDERDDQQHDNDDHQPQHHRDCHQDTGDEDKSQDQPVKFQQQQQQAQRTFSVERQDSAGSCDLGAQDADAERFGAAQAPYHRPSIIREHPDQPAEWLTGQATATATAAAVAAAEQAHSQQYQAVPSGQHGELYCGLSTTRFTRRRQQFSRQHSLVQRQQSGQQQQQSGAATPADVTQVVQQQQQQQQPTQAQQQQSQSQSQQQLEQELAGDFEQFRNSSLELISFEEENYEKHYYGREHWNYFTNDELLGPVMLSLKQEVNNQRDHFHVLLRTVSYTLHGTIPASTICADRYDREAIVRELSEIAKLKPPLMLGQLPSTPDELLKLDHIFIKTELKVGVIYIKQGQEESEESILGNRDESPLFTEFLDLLGDRITLKGFDRYKGGLDTVHNLTGTESVYTMWRNIEIMFHVSTMLPHEENDPQKLQKKRHIGNDIVCVAFIESDDTLFWPGCIKSYFLHTFIAVRTSPKPLKEGERRKYFVSCVCRNEVQYAFRPYLVEQDNFYKSDYFREWLLVKIVNGERASYSAPKFARMQDRTRSQLLEDIITNLANHLVTGQIPKPYRRGSWRPLGHTRASSPLEDSMKDYFEDYDQLAKDFSAAFCGPNKSVLCDVAFRVKDADGSQRLVHGVRAILAIRSRTFLEMLYGFTPPGAGQSSLQNQTNLRAIEMRALSGESAAAAAAAAGDRADPHAKSLLAKRGSVGGSGDSGRRIGEKERRQSMLPNLSKSISQKPNYLTVPSTGGAGGGGAGAGSAGSVGVGGGSAGTGTGSGGGAGPGGMIKNAFNRLVSGNWSGWSGNIKGYKGEPMHIKVDQNKAKVDLNSLAICKEIAKIDADKLNQTEFEIKEFDYETFQQTIEYIHNGQCKLSYETIPGLICAAEHYDLPDLLHACFHHANTHMRLSAAPRMMNALYQNSCFYITAMQLLDAIYEYIDPHGNEFFNRPEYLELYESVFSSLLCRKTLQVDELKKFQAMDGWARQQAAKKVQQQQLAKLQRKQSGEQQQQQPLQFQLQQAAPAAGDQQQVALGGLGGAASAAGDQSQQQQQQQHWPLQAQLQQPAPSPPHPQQQQLMQLQHASELVELEYRNLMARLNKDVNIKLLLISNEDLVKFVLPTRVFNNDKIFEVMSEESRNDC